MEVAKYKIAKCFILTSRFGRRLANGAILSSTPKVLICQKNLLGSPNSRALSEKIVISRKMLSHLRKVSSSPKKLSSGRKKERCRKQLRTLPKSGELSEQVGTSPRKFSSLGKTGHLSNRVSGSPKTFDRPHFVLHPLESSILLQFAK
jgi:hypothetical protein